MLPEQVPERKGIGERVVESTLWMRGLAAEIDQSHLEGEGPGVDKLNAHTWRKKSKSKTETPLVTKMSKKEWQRVKREEGGTG